MRLLLAAKANPKLIAGSEIDGGGAYGDGKVDDDFYWAAAELYVSTAKAEYRQFIEVSPFHKRFRMRSVITWDWDMTRRQTVLRIMAVTVVAILPGGR